ncbi:hypothetical protein Tco_0126432 [Tanacetum coccineum]
MTDSENPGFTKVIINHFLKQHKSLSNIKYQHYHTIKDDGIVSRLKFVRIEEDYQEYGLAIPDVMLNDAIKQSESYQMLIKYSTGQIPPKKSRGKCLQGKKTVDDSQEIVDVSEESEPEHVALELGKSISLTEDEEEAVKQVHATHARIVTESVPESAKKKNGSRSSRSVVIQDTPSAPNPKPATSKPKLKGVQSLTPAEKEAADIMQTLKESKKTSKRQPDTRGSSEGIGTIPWVLEESTVVSATSNEGTESKYLEEDQLNDEEKDDKEGDADDEGNDHISDTQDTDDEDAKTVSDEDEIYKNNIHVRKDEDVEMTNVEVEDSEKGNTEISDVAQADVEKTEEIKDAAKKTKLPPTSSSLSVSSGFGDQFLKLSYDNSLVSIVKDNTDAEINLLLEVKIQSEVPHIESPSVLRVLVPVIFELIVLTPVQETSSVAPVTTLPFPSVSTTPYLRGAKLENDVSALKNIDHSAKTIDTLKSQVPTVVDNYLG